MLNEDPDLSVVDMQGKINKFLITTFALHLDSFKTCIRYFLSNFSFSPNNSPSKTMKNVFYFI